MKPNLSLIVHIRRAKPSDIPTIIEYNLAHAKEIEGLQLNEDVLRLGVENALKRKECHYFVAESDGNVIGQTMITYEWSDLRKSSKSIVLNKSNESTLELPEN